MAQTNSGETAMEAQPIRKLGHNEAYQLAMYILNQYRGTSVSCRYVIPPPLRGPSARPRLVGIVQNAISQCVLKHPVLQVGISDAETSQPTFVRLDSLDLRQHIEWQYLGASSDFEATLVQVTMSQLDALFPRMEKQPGWRMVILHQQEADFLEILFTWNHPHADGMSGKIFHQDLFDCLNAEMREDHREEFDTFTLRLPNDATTRLPPPIERIMELPLDVKYLAKALWDDSKPRVLCRNATLAHWAPIVSLPYKTQFRSFTIKNDILSKLLSACKRHATTLTGLFHGLVLLSLALQEDRVAASGFQGATTINMRRFVPSSPEGCDWLIPDRTMGNFVTVIHHAFDTGLVAKIRSAKFSTHEGPDAVRDKESMDLIWDTAIKVRREIEDKLNLGVRNDIVGTMKFVKDWNAQMKRLARRPRQASWMITGLGVLEGRTQSEQDAARTDMVSDLEENTWHVRRAQFALSAEVPAAALMISPMTVLGEGLCVGGSWQDGAVDTTVGEHVMADLERWMGHIAGL
ncbi:alcohol acetyltransferase-domain-containing protein [Xylariaceae sp. FL0594]|nr:alcohol acetyltransferase-domain-containing protein [Xylariaceae sp. FL0594]